MTWTTHSPSFRSDAFGAASEAFAPDGSGQALRMTPEQIRDRLETGMRSLLEYSDAPWNMSPLQKKALVGRLKSVNRVRREIDRLIGGGMPHGAAYEGLVRLVDDFDHHLQTLREFGARFLPAHKAPHDFVHAAEETIRKMTGMVQELLQAGATPEGHQRSFEALDQVIELGAKVTSDMDADIVSDATRFEATLDLARMNRLMCRAEKLRQRLPGTPREFVRTAAEILQRLKGTMEEIQRETDHGFILALGKELLADASERAERVKCLVNGDVVAPGWNLAGTQEIGGLKQLIGQMDWLKESALKRGRGWAAEPPASVPRACETPPPLPPRCKAAPASPRDARRPPPRPPRPCTTRAA